MDLAWTGKCGCETEPEKLTKPCRGGVSSDMRLRMTSSNFSRQPLRFAMMLVVSSSFDHSAQMEPVGH